MADRTKAAISYMRRFHEQRAKKAVGFEAFSELGNKLDDNEIISISMYASDNGANRNYVSSVLKSKGRPYSLEDVTFTKECRLCLQLVNYCNC